MPLAAGRGPYPGRTSSRVSFAMNACVRMYSPASGKVMSEDSAGVKRDNEGARGRDMMPNLPNEEGVVMDQLAMIENTMMNTTDPISFDLGFEESIARVDEFNLIITDESMEQSPPDSPPSEDDRFLTTQLHHTHEQTIANLHSSNAAPTAVDDINAFSAPRAPSASESTKVFVGNLAGDINEEELGRMFTQFGNVVEIVLHRRRSMLGSGSAFIRFAESHAAHASIAALNGSSKGRGRRSRLPLVVRIADPPKNNAAANNVAKAEANPQALNVVNNKPAHVSEFCLSATKTVSRGPLGTSTITGQHIQATILSAPVNDRKEGLPTSKSLEYASVLKQHNPYSFECYIEKEHWEESKAEGSPITEHSNAIMYVNRDEPELFEMEWAGQETDGSSSFDSIPSLDWVGGRGNVSGETPLRVSYNSSPSSFRHSPSPQPMVRAPSPYACAAPPVLPPYTTPYVPASHTYASLNTHRKYSSWQTPHPPAIPLRGSKANRGAAGLPMSSTAPVSLTNFEWPADADLLSMSPVGASLWEDMSQLLRPTTSASPPHATFSNNNAGGSNSSSASSLHAHRPSNASVRPSAQVSSIGGDTNDNASSSAPALSRDSAARFTSLDHLPASAQRLDGFHQPQFSSASMTPTASGLASDWVPHAEVPTSAGRWGAQWA